VEVHRGGEVMVANDTYRGPPLQGAPSFPGQWLEPNQGGSFKFPLWSSGSDAGSGVTRDDLGLSRTGAR
jgi:hypothetical protein